MFTIRNDYIILITILSCQLAKAASDNRDAFQKSPGPSILQRQDPSTNGEKPNVPAYVMVERQSPASRQGK